MSKPDFITFTGADDNTAIADMMALAADHPVEFGILFLKSLHGTPRYPTLAWSDRAQASGLRLAAHICGSDAEEIVSTGRSRLDGHLRAFTRIQINTSSAVNPVAIRRWTDELAARYGHSVEPILQCRGPFPADDQISWLYDRSGGTGLLPETWPAPTAVTKNPVGYAGGLGPDTIEAALRRMPDLAGKWIDMETRIRNADDRFDLGLCRAVCEIVYGNRIQ
jgi:hypothetical protein